MYFKFFVFNRIVQFACFHIPHLDKSPAGTQICAEKLKVHPASLSEDIHRAIRFVLRVSPDLTELRASACKVAKTNALHSSTHINFP